MSNIIPAAPGWRLCAWIREHGHAMGLPIVAWREIDNGRGDGGIELQPLVLGWEGSQVGPLSEWDLFVGIMPPGSELSDYTEAAEEVAKGRGGSRGARIRESAEGKGAGVTPSLLDIETEITRMAKCGTKEASCVCVLPAAHDGAHECDCGGSWTFDGGEFVIVSLPIQAGMYPLGRSAA